MKGFFELHYWESSKLIFQSITYEVTLDVEMLKVRYTFNSNLQSLQNAIDKFIYFIVF